jgi:hypothetical protein
MTKTEYVKLVTQTAATLLSADEMAIHSADNEKIKIAVFCSVAIIAAAVVSIDEYKKLGLVNEEEFAPF